VRLELGEWNGLVEPRVLLRALCPTEPAACAVLGEDEEFWPAFERALAGEALQTAVSSRAARELRDCRGSGFGGVAGDLLSTGEGVALVCADVPRRLGTLEQILGGTADRCGGRLAAISWDALRADPSRVRGYAHLVALDPPVSRADELLLSVAACDPPLGLGHLAWGEAEVEFSLKVAELRFNLRPALTRVYRELREAGACSGERLELILRGPGPFLAGPRDCARTVRALLELGLADLDSEGEFPLLRLLETRPTKLERSPTYRSSMERLERARTHLRHLLARAA
jgi:hypothetical protein